MTHKLPKDRITHGIVLFDPHFPYEDKRSYNAVMQYVAKSQPNVFVLGGDIVDLDIISDKSKARHVEGKRLSKDFAHARNRLVEINETIPNAIKYALEGNHDERMERYLDDHPECEGILEVPTMLDLDNLGWTWVPSWRKGEVLNIGKAGIIHGYTESKNHASKTVDDYGKSMFYGHLHTNQMFTKILHGDDSTIMAQAVGCICRYDMPYLRGKPTKWQQAFLDIYWLPNGHFFHNVVPIFNHEFVVNGEYYGD